jgi:hypothetical protein
MTQPDLPYGPGNSQPAPGRQPDAAPSARPSARRRRRSIAWIYYGIIAILAVIATFSTGKPQMLIVTVLCTAYAIYIYRGGRIVFWIW